MKEDPKYDGLKVDKWQVAIVTSPERKGLPQQKIKIEIMNIPAYSSEPHTLLHNYDFLPDGYSDTLIMTESLDEIMTDKLIAFVNCDRYIRYRDIWDLRWLIQKGAQLNIQWFNQKISDYQISDYETKLSNKIESISTIIYSDQFKHEMQRFIPYDTQQRTLQKDKFYSFLTNEITTLLTTVQQTFLSAPDDSEFLM